MKKRSRRGKQRKKVVFDKWLGEAVRLLALSKQHGPARASASRPIEGSETTRKRRRYLNRYGGWSDALQSAGMPGNEETDTLGLYEWSSPRSRYKEVLGEVRARERRKP